MSITDDLLANNESYAESYPGPLPLPPSGHLAVIACMDARLDIFGILGLEGGRRTSSATRAASSPTTRSAR